MCEVVLDDMLDMADMVLDGKLRLDFATNIRLDDKEEIRSKMWKRLNQA